jgi:hypothetical protein
MIGRNPPRRTILAGAVASFGTIGLGGCVTGRDIDSTSNRADLPQKGTATLSQSVMLSGANAEGTHFAAIRACQYPETGVTWLWAMVHTTSGFYQFAANNIPWSGPKLTEPDAEMAEYLAELPQKARAHYRRGGTLKLPKRVKLEAAFDSDGQWGADRGRVSLAAEFAPLSGFAGLLPGRTEAFGQAQFAVTIDGKPVTFSGPAQFHEQSQTSARFVDPFVFASLWSADMFSTLLDAPPNSGGYVIDVGKPRGLVNPSFDPGNAEARTVKLAVEDDGKPTNESFEVVRAYGVPLYGDTWRGRFVRGNLLGRPVVGMLNSWQRTP